MTEDFRRVQVDQKYIIVAPAAGADIDNAFAEDYIRTNTRWMIRNIYFELDTDANAANRFITIAIEDENEVVIWRQSHATAVTANQLAYVNCQPRHYKDWDAVSDTMVLPLPYFFIRVDYSITITTTNIQVGDQLTDIHIAYDAYEGVLRTR